MPSAYGNRRIEVTAGNVADGIGHREHGQAEGERDANPADADIRKAGCENGTAAAAEYEPESSKGFSDQFVFHAHGGLGVMGWFCWMSWCNSTLW